MKDKKMKVYFSSKNITNEDTLFVKAGEIDVLLAICAYKFSDKSLSDELAESWQKIIDPKISDEDVKFVKLHDWKEGGYSVTLFNNIKTKKFVKATDVEKKEYLRRIWFFVFMSKNCMKTDRNKLRSTIDEMAKKDKASRGKKPTLFDLNEKYNGRNVSDKQYKKFWEKINTSYLVELESILEQIKKILLSNTSGRFSQFFKLFGFATDGSHSKSTPKKAIVSEKASRSQEIKATEAGAGSKENSGGQVATNTKNVPTTKEVAGDIAKEELKEQSVLSEKVQESPKETVAHQELAPDNLPQEDGVATQETAQTEEKVIRLIKHQEVVTKREDYFSLFEENIGKIYELSGKLSEEAMYRGVEELITTLNSPVYEYLLDRLYLATQNKEKVSNDFYSVACLIKNALEEKNFVFEFYPNEPLGTCIGASSESDREYIGRNYRFKGKDLLYKNLYIAAPGIKNRKTKLFVCLPLVEVK